MVPAVILVFCTLKAGFRPKEIAQLSTQSAKEYLLWHRTSSSYIKTISFSVKVDKRLFFGKARKREI